MAAYSCRLTDWQDQTKNLVEEDGIRLLCLYLDQKSGKVNLLADSESQRNLGESRAAIKDIESILENRVDEKVKLSLYDHNRVREGEGPCSKSSHICHHPAPIFQLTWERNLPASCFTGNKGYPDVKDYDKLPAEILRTIFGFLKPEDLKKVLLVSKRWRSVADEPFIWTGFDLPQKCRENSDNFYKFLNFSLSSKLQHLTLSGSEAPPDEDLDVNVDYFKFEIKDEHIHHLINLQLVSIAIKRIDLSKVSDDLLAKLVNSCKQCDITEYYEDYPTPPNNNFLDLSSDDDDVNKLFLGVKKITAILRESQEEGSKLKSLRFRHLRKIDGRESAKLDLSSIPADILATAFKKLEVLDLENLQFTSEQLSSVFKDGLGRGLRRLRLHGVEMDFIQARHLMKTLDTRCQLKKLDLSEVDVSKIPSMFLAGVLIKIEWVVLKDLKIKSDQIEDIFLSITRGDSAMKHLGMFGMNDSLSEVDEEEFAAAVNLLESVAFDETLSKDLIVEMFDIMSIATNLKFIGMPGKEIPVDAFENIQEVDEKVLTEALNNLRSVRLDLGNYDRDCFLTMPQLITFFKQLSSRSELKRIVREDFPDWSRFPY